MEIYSDSSIAYNSEGFARLYGWWTDDEDEDDFLRPKKEKKQQDSDGNETQSDGWDEKN